MMALGTSSNPIVEISELTQLVVDHLLLDSPRSLVSLACTCRALEGQALSALWSEQSSLHILIKSTLPPRTLYLSESESPPKVHNGDRSLAKFLMDLSSLQGSSGIGSNDMRTGCAGSTSTKAPPFNMRFSV